MKIKIFPVLLSRYGSEVSLFADGSSLSIATLTSYAKVYKQGVLLDDFDFQTLIEHREADWDYYTDNAQQNPPAIWLFSCYMWNCDDNLEMAKKIKAISPDSITIFGGPHVPKYEVECEQFFHDNPAVDITARAEGEITFAEILETIAADNGNLKTDLSNVDGISFRDNDGNIIRTKDRVRTRDLDIFPSPYLSGELDHECFDGLNGLILETNRGCPYGCTFCDWGAATLQKVSLFDLDRIREEIFHIGKRRTNSIYIADANFGAFERDLDIARFLVESKQKHGYPRFFACNYAKNPTPRLAKIIKTLNEGGMLNSGIISMQSTNEATLDAIDRSNINTRRYEKLIDIFREEGLKLSSELMIGLPGQTYESHREDLQFFIDRKLMAVIYNTQLMPNAPMNEPGYREKYKLVTNDDKYVIASSTFTEDQYSQMQELFLAFQLFYVLGVLKYFLYYLQIEHRVRMIDFIETIISEADENKALYPRLHKIKHDLLTKVDERRVGMPILLWRTSDSEFLFEDMDTFYNEVIDLAARKFDVTLTEKERNTFITAQKAVMPKLGKQTPFSVELDHDLVEYFVQIKNASNVEDLVGNIKPLSSFPEGDLKVTSVKQKTIDNLGLIRINQHNNAGWELRSALRFY
jgi:radical SAM superfamily enzyme YgiQ (UPF0313 family)